MKTFTPLYLRDLKEHLQKEYIDQWEKDKRKDLLKAYKKEEDIKIGEYCNDGEEEVI